MQLLGQYNGTISQFYYQGLLALTQKQIAAGAPAFSDKTLAALVAMAKDFLNLPVPSEGDVADAEAFNYPLSLLAARVSALQSEIDAFKASAQAYLAVLAKETALLDQLLNGADLNVWASTRFVIPGAQNFQWDFRIGAGLIDPAVTPTDPSNGVDYASSVNTATIFSLETGAQASGFIPEVRGTVAEISSLVWSSSSAGQQESYSGPDWASLSMLESSPLLSYPSGPSVDVLLPTSGVATDYFAITGAPATGALPVYVQTSFLPRRNTLGVSPANGCPDPAFTQSKWTLNGWVIDTSGTTAARRDVGSAGTLQSAALLAAVAPGDRIYASLMSWNTIGATGTLQMSLGCYDEAGNLLASPALDSVTPIVGSQLVSGVVQVPEIPGIVSAKILVTTINQTTGSWYVSTAVACQPLSLSAYQIDQNNLYVYTTNPVTGLALKVLTEDQDYVVDSLGRVTFMGAVSGQYSIRFSESYPAYSCSIDGKTYSSAIMLDPARPYPDAATSFWPIAFGPNGEFPITDEIGTPLGLYLTMKAPPPFEFLLLVSTPANPEYGASATLTVALDHVSYLSGISLSSFSSLPATLTSVEVEGLTPETLTTVWRGELLLDRPYQFTFARQMVGSVILTFTQTNYSYQTYVVSPSDALRRNILSSLQQALPISAQVIVPAEPVYYTGTQYDFAVENISVFDTDATLPEVVVSGPYRVTGIPDLAVLNVESSGTTSAYLCFRAYSSGGVVVDENLVGVALTAGQPVVFPFSSSLTVSTVAYVDCSLKFVLRTADASVGKWQLSVTTA